MKRTIALIAATLTGLSTWLAATPAYAAPAAPNVTEVNDGTAGHVTATVTSPGAPYLIVRITTPGGNVMFDRTLPGDSGPIDIPTWGLGAGARSLSVSGCTSSRVNCSAASAPVDVVLKDVRPTVGFSEDPKVGPNETPITIAAEDTGGGKLVARWTIPNRGTYTYDLDEHGATEISPITEGAGTIEVVRCSTELAYTCSSFSPKFSRDYTHLRSLPMNLLGSSPTRWVGADTDSISYSFQSAFFDGWQGFPLHGTYEVEWYLADLTGTASGTLAEDGSLAPLVIDTSSLEETPFASSYQFTAYITVTDPEFGLFESQSTGASSSLSVVVDRTAPQVTASIVAKTIYPNAPADLSVFPQRTSISLTGSGRQEVSWLHFRSANGSLVAKRSPSYRWDGKTNAGVVLPAGNYTVSAIDTAGNETGPLGTITVEPRKVVKKVWQKTVTAQASLVDSYVGRCSTLRKPAARGWAGSLGFYANTRCPRQTWRASAVSTVHGIRLPAVRQRTGVHIDVYGGAARARSQSWAGFRLLGTDGEWRDWTGLRPTLQLHRATWINEKYARAYINPDRTVYWGMATAARDRYDVARFVIRMSYYGLA